MPKYRNHTNKKFYVVQRGPCRMCGFAGKINDWSEALKRGEHSHIITCPRCGGKGCEEERIRLVDALAQLTEV